MNKKNNKKRNIIYLTIVLGVLIVIYSLFFKDYTEKSSNLTKISKEVTETKDDIVTKQETLETIDEMKKKTEIETEEIKEVNTKNKQELNVLKTKENVLRKEINDIQYENNQIKENLQQ